MSSPPPSDIAAIILDGTAIDRAIVAARRRVVETHRQLGIPLVIWRDGKVVEIPADTVAFSQDAQEAARVVAKGAGESG